MVNDFASLVSLEGRFDVSAFTEDPLSLLRRLSVFAVLSWVVLAWLLASASLHMVDLLSINVSLLKRILSPRDVIQNIHENCLPH